MGEAKTPKILKDDLRYLVFGEVFQRFDEPKKQRRAFSLIEISIQCFDKKGFAHVTLEMIAREAGITRQALTRYFESVDEIREVSLKYIRILGQKMALEQILKTKDPAELLKSYVDVHFKWATVYKAHARVWLGFLSSCSRRERDRELNHKAITTGHERITQLVLAGQMAGVFKCADVGSAAKVIQTLITGWSVTLLTEDLPDAERQTQAMLAQCLLAVGYKAPVGLTSPRTNT